MKRWCFRASLAALALTLSGATPFAPAYADAPTAGPMGAMGAMQAPTPLSADESSLPGIVREWPKLGSETAVNLEFDHRTGESDPDGGALNLQGNQQFLLEFDRHFSISNLWTLQPLDDIQPGRTRVLGRHALFVEELFARWDNQVVNIRAGKFAQNFARGWYLVPGLYGQDFTGDYALAETNGADIQIALNRNHHGLHTISVSAFNYDHTFLSDSLINRRGPLHIADGGAGNTRAPKSFVVSYDGTNIPAGHNIALDYQVSYANLAKGVDGDSNEHRYAASADIQVPLGGGTIEQTLRGRFNELRLFAEAVRIDHVRGFSGFRADYQTVAAEVASGPWVFDLSGSLRRLRDDFGNVVKDDLQTASIGYNLPSDTVVALGVSREYESGQRGWLFGISIAQVITTCDRCLIRSRHY